MIKKKKIAIGSDHNGFHLKNFIIDSLKESFDILDIGPYEFKKIDYPDVSYQLSKLIENEYIQKGILICGTGVGMSITANRNPNINAALVQHVFGAKLSVEHNDANVLCLSSWAHSKKTNLEITKIWLNTKFHGGRHLKRLGKFSKKKNVSIVSGIFDLLHHGHIELLNYAKNISKNLIVLINSDSSAKRNKGLDRPFLDENTRKQILMSFSIIKDVIIFNDDSPGKIINEIKPDFYIKGSEFTAKQIRKRDQIDENIEIKTFPMNDEYSFNSLIKKIKKAKN